jgi:hypothetical protein
MPAPGLRARGRLLLSRRPEEIPVTRFDSLRPAGALLVAVAALALPGRASAEDRPHKLAGSAQFISPTDFVGSGEATHLGRYAEAGCARFSPTADPAVLLVDAWTTLTAANGDRLCETITGRLDLRTGAITATVTYVGGTGRFADAGGSAALSGQMLPDGTIAVSVEGTIDY